ncbi:hypothetical protein OAG1_28410 [Agarivorans sp. OAG1]|uniref:capsular polysaccharide export protein, LipB/KpsS family n=1 Tax=Agarivorans sp. OAG1 TaxID=3082387 RepID=UPI002B2F9097|nr:hypothetical protein OAG1_28410 [Agarivorans sp. OAG1]
MIEVVANRKYRTLYCVGFSLWKRSFVYKYVRDRANCVRFIRCASLLTNLEPTDAILVWGRKSDLFVDSTFNGVDVLRMEDGFLRSVGLGSNLRRPNSLVIDEQGIYYDPTKPSKLETLLSTHCFSEQEIARSRALIETIRRSKLSKYNVGQTGEVDFRKIAKGKVLILIPGQVEDDASVTLGCVNVKTNTQLIQSVKTSHPDAFIIYKPHPDVLCGNRKGGVAEATLSKYCDLVVTDIDVISCINAVDELHTMTSLSGFEALLHKKKVTCYGLPFYAGWGLTKDIIKHPYRNRILSLYELVFASLVLYPSYYHWKKDQLTTPELTIDSLESERLLKGAYKADSAFSSKINTFIEKTKRLIETVMT